MDDPRQAGPGVRATLADALVLLLAGIAVYANAFEHAFHLDSLHTIVDNPAVRRLADWPAFFTDLGTASTLPSNSDYRPVLMVTYALNHAASGYAMPGWHATQIGLHVACALGLYGLARWLGRGTLRPAARRWTALATALVFVVHPTGAGVVDYQAARSSLLAAALGLAAILAHAASARRRAWLVAAVVAFALALFTKVEAIACLAVFVLMDALERARGPDASGRFLGDLFGGWRSVLLRLTPHLLVAAAYFAARGAVMAEAPFGESSRAPGVGPYPYLLTQTTAWWAYVAHWFFPRGLVADDSTFPIRTGLGDAAVLGSILGWLAVAAGCVRAWRRRPYLLVACAGALALISPTSSVVPLAEMVNEHRPYLPMAVLSCAWMLLLGEAVQARARLAPLAGFILGAAVVALAVATWNRNEVFATQESYWRDVLAKAPSARAHANYARLLMARGEFEPAVAELEAALELAPYYYITHINLGVALAALGQDERAAEHFDLGVEHDAYTATGLYYRGEFLVERGRYAAALADFERTLERGREAYRSHKGLATARAGLADADAALAHTRRCLGLDAERTGLDIRAIALPFFADDEHAAAGVRFFEGLREHLPEAWWVHENLGILCTRLGRTAEAAAAYAESRRLR